MKIVLIELTVLIISVFTNGIFINIYGETCGISLLNPSSWIRYITLAGSPWCKSVYHIIFVTDKIISYVWIHAIPAFLISIIKNYLPGFDLYAEEQ